MTLQHNAQTCAGRRMAILDTLELISGKWKLPILMALVERPFRFKELSKAIGITPRMLARELHTLEMNMLVSRTEIKGRPLAVVYAITEYGHTFREVVDAMKNWGIKHRQKIILGH